jgi:hypothetical protein
LKTSACGEKYTRPNPGPDHFRAGDGFLAIDLLKGKHIFWRCRNPALIDFDRAGSRFQRHEHYRQAA